MNYILLEKGINRSRSQCGKVWTSGNKLGRFLMMVAFAKRRILTAIKTTNRLRHDERTHAADRVITWVPEKMFSSI